jgi:hypothetical protein
VTHIHKLVINLPDGRSVVLHLETERDATFARHMFTRYAESSGFSFTYSREVIDVLNTMEFIEAVVRNLNTIAEQQKLLKHVIDILNPNP